VNESHQNKPLSILDHFRRPQLPDFRHSAAVATWATAHFPGGQRPVAALLAGILCEQVGDCLAQLHPSSHFNRDIAVYDYFDAADYVAAIEEQFHISIPEQQRQHLQHFTDLVQYVHTNTQ
jgi:acyl carrier protein